jgi:urease accessory protein
MAPGGPTAFCWPALAIAFQPTKERHLEATAQGRAFLTTVAATWPNERLAGLADHFREMPVAYAVAVGIAAGCHDVPLGATLNAFLGGFAANLVSAAIRAVPLGQTEGQRVIANLSPIVEAIAASAASESLDALGGAAWRADIASMKHETQYTRLFRS